MECAGIQELLSEYIDGTLDAQARAAVGKHISTCENCQEELASLRAMVDELSALEHVQAPADFLEKIHERMAPRIGFDWILRKLFVPLRIKVPLELAAAATIAILVFVVFDIQQAERQIVPIPEVATSERFAARSKEDRMKPAFKKEPSIPAPALEEAPAKRSERGHEMRAPESTLKTVPPSIERESGPSASFLAKARMRQAVSRGEPIELVLVVKAGLARSAYEPDAAVKAAPRLLSKMNQLIKRVEGQVLSVEHDRQTDQLKSIHTEIPAKSYESFCRELTRLATFRTPPPPLADKDPAMIRIQIRFISSK